jgi:hypothetical protein
VPPWEDEKFMQFTELWNRDIEQLDNDNLLRSFDLKETKQHAKLMVETREKAMTK